MIFFAGCNSGAAKELNPFEQTSLNKAGKYEVLSQKGYITPNCYVSMDDFGMSLDDRTPVGDGIFMASVSVTNEGTEPSRTVSFR